MRSVTDFFVACLFGLIVASCNSSQEEELRTWRQSDHDHVELLSSDGEKEFAVSRVILPPETPSSSIVRQSPHRYEGSRSAEAMRTWTAYCVRCHGRIGSGDGPDGSDLMPRAFSNVEWQRATTDADIGDVVLNGLDVFK